MAKSASKRPVRLVCYAAKGPAASRLRQRKYALARKLGLPAELLGGSLTLTHRRCGKPACRCASDPGHPLWTLTYSVEGQKHVQAVPAASVAALQPLLLRARVYRDALSELLAINAQLVSLWRQQQRARRPRR
jgi:hypothetical protein